MSIRLRELIKSVRQAKTAADERTIISKESAALRNAFKDQDATYRHRNVAKLMYIHMMGYPSHFGQMECLKLIATAGFAEKRIGYLALMLLLDERQEVLMLVTNSIKNDLGDRNQHIVGLALCALGNIGSAEMCRDLAPEITKLLRNQNPYIRKKAALCAVRTIRKVPEMIEEFQTTAPDLLSDRHHGVLLTGVELLLEICASSPEVIPSYAVYTKQLVKILKQLVMSKFSPEHDVGGINDPFLQCRILRLLRYLGRGNAEASDAMSDILAQVATNTEPSRNAGNAILYECVETIMGVESTQGLRVLAVNIMGRFLSNKDNNIRYVALNTLAKVVAVDTQAVQRHRNTVVDCVKDADVSIRRRALELVYALINESNIKTLTKELLDYLKVSDNAFKPDLASKISQLVLKFAPDRRWYMDNMVSLLTQAGPHIKPEIWRSLIVVVTNTPELQGYIVRTMYSSVSGSLSDTADGPLILVAVWIIGEYCNVLVDGSQPLQTGEARVAASGADVVKLLQVLLNKHSSDIETREYIMTALIKCAAYIPETRASAEALIQRHTATPLLEVQQRSCEFDRLLKSGNPQLFAQLLEHMPALTEAEYMKAAGSVSLQSAADTMQASPTQAPAAAAAASDPMADLMGLDLMGLDTAPAGAPAEGAPAQDAIQDLLGLDLGGPPAQQQPQGAMGAATGLEDLFGGSMTTAAISSAPPSAAAAAAAQQQQQFPPVTAYDKDGVLVSLAFSKPDPAQPGLTDALATVTYGGGSLVGNFSLQVAVPKFMQLRLEPASGNALQPGGPPITQSVHLTNSAHGQKAVALRLRLSYVVDGHTTVEMAEVNNLPPGL